MLLNAWFDFCIKVSLFTSCCWCHQALASIEIKGQCLKMMPQVVTSSTRWFLLCCWHSNHSLGVFSCVWLSEPCIGIVMLGFFYNKTNKFNFRVCGISFWGVLYTQELKMCFFFKFLFKRTFLGFYSDSTIIFRYAYSFTLIIFFFN